MKLGEEIKIAEIFFKTIEHFYPKLNKWIKEIADPRNKKK